MVRPQKLFSANRILAWFLGTPFTSYPQRLQGHGGRRFSACRDVKTSWQCAFRGGGIATWWHTVVLIYKNRNDELSSGVQGNATACAGSRQELPPHDAALEMHLASLIAVSPPSTPVFMGRTCNQGMSACR